MAIKYSINLIIAMIIVFAGSDYRIPLACFSIPNHLFDTITYKYYILFTDSVNLTPSLNILMNLLIYTYIKVYH